MYTILLLGAVVSTSAFLDSFILNSLYNMCPQGQFACTNGQCIPNILRCDGNTNCKDASDEKNCEEYLCKGPKFFRCKNNRCITKVFVCDGGNDCEDFSDEESCGSFKISDHINSTCEKDHWQCTDKLCIPEEWVCNGDIDCLDGSDEGIGCSANITCDGFKCKNGHCIPSEWRCDGHDDCHDKSDEENCGKHISIENCNPGHEKFLCWDNKTCIDINLVCNNVSDCPDNSDENVSCRLKNITCGEYGCEYNCVSLPTGPECICPNGHRLNGKKCEDINECDQFDICDQKCRNTLGSYECVCESRYKLQEDKKTCKVVNGEAMMIFSSKTEIRAYTLESQLYYSVAKNMKQVVGVDYDGHHIYWTDIFLEHESIVRSIEDGSEKELIVTSGLGLPEDLSIDWLTGNVYFTDAENKHIGVCTDTGMYCTILVNKDIRKPRGIVLNVEKGDMYWTDWGNPAEIAYSLMDGSNTKPFVSKDIYWPNGLALDNPNGRLYWTDAKKMTIESIKLDGTDRRMVLEGLVKHPYAIAVFENKLYWSDWVTRSVQSCNKFSGKDHQTIIKEDHEFIYGISIFHSALHQRSLNPCSLALCSDICLLKGNSYTCACPPDKKLSSDGHVCKEVGKKQMLIVGLNDKLIHIEHTLLGKHDVTYIPNTVKHVGALTYDSAFNNLIISDLHTKQIISLNLNKGISEPLDIRGLGHVVAMDYDPMGNNLYLCDIERDVLEVVNLNTLARKVLLHSFNSEIPEAIALVSEEGVMFVAFQKLGHRHSHLDRFYMDGTGRTHTVFENDLIGPIALHYDADMHRIFVADAGTGNIESTSIEGDDRHSFRSLSTTPIDITSLNNHVFWINDHSKRIYWADKYLDTTYNKKITLDIPDPERMHIVSVVPKMPSFSPCRMNNNNCSHLCLMSHKSVVCACPSGFELSDNNHTCIKQAYCNATEFLCSKSNTCILKKFTCNGRQDCPHGEDEIACTNFSTCTKGYFQCTNGDCIKEERRCDHNYDCKDKSDEQNCNKTRQCAADQFMCENGECIPKSLVCDENPDCKDKSDEVPYNCQSRTCLNSQFRCNSGACIPKDWECDHDYDCPDFSDEHPDCIYTSCPPNSFTCTNGKCIDRSLYCDEVDDCGDNSDEHLCLKNLGSCNYEEFSCLLSNKSICLPQSAVCNGTKECPLGEDEKDCSNCVHGEEFTCEENHKCIPNEWVCDGIDDCGNNSDEKADMCKKKQDLYREHFSSNHAACENGYRCKDGKCIQLALTCNKKHDCYDGSDEDGMCNTSCVGSQNPCSQACFRTPVGPTCMCYDGYTLMANGYGCVDKNECLDDPPVCSQLCHNEDGGYRCDCYEGYFLRSNKKSCKADGKSMSIIFITDDQIREQNQRTNHLSVLFSADMPRITGLDVLIKSKTIYFSTESASSIHRIDFKAQTRHFINNVGQPQKIALDWATNNVYYYNNEAHANSVGVCNFEAMCAQLIKVDAHRQVSALAVDSVNKFLFIALSSWWVFNSPNYAIYRYNLDGTGSKQIVETTSGFITGLTYDFNKKYLYYADQHSNIISKTNYEGTSKTVLFSNVTKSTGLKFFEDHLYYLTSGGYMVKCKLYDVRQCLNFKLHSYLTDLFTIAQDSLQPSVKNVCNNHTCTYLCIMGQNSYKCLCKNGAVVSPHQSCNSTKTGIENKTALYVVHSVPVNESFSKKHSGTVAAAVLIPLALLIIAGGLLIVAKKKSSRRLNISMRFYNPTYQSHVEDEKPILQPGLHEYTNPAHYRRSESTDTNSKLNQL